VLMRCSREYSFDTELLEVEVADQADSILCLVSVILSYKS
jgi:hypothetical protein